MTSNDFRIKFLIFEGTILMFINTGFETSRYRYRIEYDLGQNRHPFLYELELLGDPRQGFPQPHHYYCLNCRVKSLVKSTF